MPVYAHEHLADGLKLWQLYYTTR